MEILKEIPILFIWKEILILWERYTSKFIEGNKHCPYKNNYKSSNLFLITNPVKKDLEVQTVHLISLEFINAGL